MSKLVTLCLWVLGASCLLAEDEAPKGNDWLLIPEKRVGPITRDWAGDDLMRAFGTLHCVKKEIGVGEGETVSGYVLYPGTDDELEVLMNPETGKVEAVQLVAGFAPITDPKTGEWVGSKPIARETRWHSISGITLGSSLAKVTEVNGGPFDIVGWETDIAGAVGSWKGGKIPDTFSVRFIYKDSQLYSDLWSKVLNGGQWDGASDGSIMPRLGLTVNHLFVRL